MTVADKAQATRLVEQFEGQPARARVALGPSTRATLDAYLEREAGGWGDTSPASLAYSWGDLTGGVSRLGIRAAGGWDTSRNLNARLASSRSDAMQTTGTNASGGTVSTQRDQSPLLEGAKAGAESVAQDLAAGAGALGDAFAWIAENPLKVLASVALVAGAVLAVKLK